MKLFAGVVCLLIAASQAFGQGANGTITGTITDPTGLVVPAVNVEARNVETGAVYTGASTAAGNYAILNLPVGTYTVTAKAMGFKTYTHENLAIAAAQVLREDIHLEVGSAAETVTVQAEATLLKTETGEVSDNITLEEMQDLPMLGIGTVNSGTSGVRNPYNVLQTLPGVTNYSAGNPFEVNGLGGEQGGVGPGFTLTETMREEGQDATSRLIGNYVYTQMSQPNADAIQEMAVQTSTYAPEFGQAGSAVLNMTFKSGTNQFHGTAFDYFVNEDLNAGNPFSINPDTGGKERPRNRRNDFGGTLGGPVWIPKIYNGHDKTFFFFAYEQYLESNTYTFTDTVPTPAFRNGDFSAISPNGNCSLCDAYGIPTGPLGGPNYLDAAGHAMYANEIYDPLTRGTAANGLGYALPFPNNVIPASRFAASSVAFQNLFPLPTGPGLINNYAGFIPGNRYTAIPSIKVDQIVSPKDKLSFFWTRINTESQVSEPYGNADGLPLEIGGYRGTFIPNWTTRLNYDRTLTPTLLLHVGVGYYHTSFSDRAPFLHFQPSQFDLSGFVQPRQFPSVTGMCVPPPGFFPPPGCGGYGGMQTIGTSGQIQTQNYEEKPTFNTNATWVHGNHTFKAGAELYLEQVFTGNFAGVTLATGVGPTSQPFQPTVSFNGFTQGFGYASFLLGDYTSTSQTPPEFYREGNQNWGLFLQDSWKATRRLTVNYGLRWDYDTVEREQYNRLGQFSATTPNANADGHPGATIYANTCHCPFYQPGYPFGIGPRLSAAFQATPKTVIRGGWGVNYQFAANPSGATIGSAGVYPLPPLPNNAQFVNIATPGAIVSPTWPVTDPNVFPPAPGVLGAPNTPFGPTTSPYVPDPNENRPPRIMQFNIGFERQITPNLVVDVSYVGNRAVWLPAGPLGFLSQTSPQEYAAFHLYPYPGTGPCSNGGGVCKNSNYDNYDDYLLLQQPISSPQVISTMASRGITNLLPYASFPTSSSLQSILYPFPQFGPIEPANSPTGNSKYDGLQVRVNKRLSHGLQVSSNFAWAQGFDRPAPQDFFNSAGSRWVLQQIPPFDFNLTAVYTVPRFNLLPKFAKAIVGDWQIGWYSNYQSGMFLAPPASPTFNFLPSEDIRNPGVPLYTPGVNINDHSTFNAQYTQVLNPAAWSPCPVNATCAAASPGAFSPTPTLFYKDFKGPRTPTENANLGRHFRVKRGDHTYDLYIRAEFVNIFNRTLFPAPSTTSPENPVSRLGSNGPLVGGFGVISAYFPAGSYSETPPYLLGRTGTLIARFSF
jgi:hypothetical protein